MSGVKVTKETDDTISNPTVNDERREIEDILMTIDNIETMRHIKYFTQYMRDKHDDNSSIDSDETIKTIKKAGKRKLKNPGEEEKKLIMMDVLNGVLRSVSKDKINIVTDFAIKRSQLIGAEVNNYLDTVGYDHAIKNGMRKTECQWGQKSRISTFSLTFLKSIVKWGTSGKYAITGTGRVESGVRDMVYSVRPE